MAKTLKVKLDVGNFNETLEAFLEKIEELFADLDGRLDSIEDRIDEIEQKTAPYPWWPYVYPPYNPMRGPVWEKQIEPNDAQPWMPDIILRDNSNGATSAGFGELKGTFADKSTAFASELNNDRLQ